MVAQARSIHRGGVALGQISAPTLVLAGDEDPLAIRPQVLADALPDATLEMLSGDHMQRTAGSALCDLDRRVPRLRLAAAGADMGIGEIIAIAIAGTAAGTINTVVGSGTLITFPVLLAFGYAPVTANVSNTIGLVPGSVSGAIGYRRELAGQRRRALELGSMSLLGGVTGAVLLLVLPASAFKAVVPAFIAVALVLTVLQPRLNRALAGHVAARSRRAIVLLPLAVYITGVYGGYFGAGQGILLLGILAVLLPQSLHRSNALKNVLAGTVNGVAGRVFHLRCARRVGAGGDHRGVLDRRRTARRALRQAPASRRAACADRGRRRHRDRRPARQLSGASGSTSRSHADAAGTSAGSI